MDNRTVMEYDVFLQPEEDGGYSVIVPALPGCITEGDSEQEALANAKEAIQLYLEMAGDPGVQHRIVAV